MSDMVHSPSPRPGQSIADVAYLILKERHEPMKYKDLINEIIAQRGLRPGQSVAQLMAKAHTEISLDYRFQNRGGGMCGLTEWTAKPPSHRVVSLSQGVVERRRPGDRLRREMVMTDQQYEEDLTEDEPLEEPEEPDDVG
jgi:DNA-directed RNA polymerase subunit delta